jgi:hypothetical protein
VFYNKLRRLLLFLDKIYELLQNFLLLSVDILQMRFIKKEHSYLVGAVCDVIFHTTLSAID